MTERRAIPFPRAEGAFRVRQVAVAPDGTAYVVPSGMHERLRGVIAPDEWTDASPIRRFARAHDAGSVAVARHPSGEVVRSNRPSAFRFDG